MILRVPLPPIADQAVLFPWRLASVAAHVSMRYDRRQSRTALEVRAHGGAGIHVHAMFDCRSFAVCQFDEERARAFWPVLGASRPATASLQSSAFDLGIIVL